MKYPTVARQGLAAKCRVKPTLARQGVNFSGVTLRAKPLIRKKPARAFAAETASIASVAVMMQAMESRLAA
jgi:hypothetical protein